jgi:hypothetical protein
MRSTLASLTLPGFLLAVTTWSAPAHAEGSAENKAAARTLGIQGIQLAQKDDCAGAIPLLERAEALFHAPTILGSLGECQVKVGRIVEGTENLNRVAREQLAETAPPAFIQAQERARQVLAEALPKIARLTIVVAPEGVVDLQVTVSGAPVSNALIGAARPTDPGEREVVASAPGYVTAKATVTLTEGGSETVQLTLEPDPNAQTLAAASSTSPQSSATGASGGTSTQRILGYTGLGLGGALLIAGGVTGFMAFSKEKSLEESCPAKDQCDPTFEDDLESANSLATMSTVFSIAGAAIGAGGVVLILTDTSPGGDKAEGARPSLAAVVGPSSLALRGAF